MKPVYRLAVTVAALFVVATPLVAQQRTHTVILSVYGGGADHLADLQSSPPVWFMPGYDLGASVGLELNRYFAVHGDFTYTRNPTQGRSMFAGSDVNRFFYGAHLEARYPLSIGFSPFAFAGVGAVSIDQLGVDQFDPFTKPAGMVGGGVFYSLPRSRVEVFGEVKGLTYKWDRAGFDRQMFDVTYSIGASYRLPVKF
jgi:opacity protein-like surface antigen